MRYVLAIFLTAFCLGCHGQIQTIIDGDTIHLRDSLDGKVVLLSYIERGKQNREAIWITYDRRPGVDPWILEAKDREKRYSEDNFIKYLKEKDVKVLGAITTYDDCQCMKHRMMSSPDMFLIHFKIFLDDWRRFKEVYPEIEEYSREVKIK
jgi:hypothetical protein